MPTTVTSLAEQAAAAVHQLALLTRPAITPLAIRDLAAATGALSELAAALPQTLAQLAVYLNTADDLTAPDGQTTTGDVHPAIEQARNCLRQAAAAAALLAAPLDATHQTLGDLAETTKTKPGGSIFNRR